MITRNRPSWMGRSERLRIFLESQGYKIVYTWDGACIEKGPTWRPFKKACADPQGEPVAKPWWRWW